MGKWREPGWARGQCALKQNDWDDWKKRYLAGEEIPCPVCGHRGHVTLSPLRHVVIHGCGHIMELPERTDP